MPYDVFYEKNPEYYALRNGKRLPTQLCLTNNAVLEIIKDSVRSFFKNSPISDVISVSQDDNTQYCQCENCSKIDNKEGSPAGSLIHFVNDIAKDFPDKTISTLAYQYTRKPPKTKPLENVLITLCSIECDRSIPIDEGCKDFSSDLKGWSSLTDNIRIWDYTTQFTNFLAPFPNWGTIKPNINLFVQNNAKWIFEQHSRNDSELFDNLNYENVSLIAEKLMSLFLDQNYDHIELIYNSFKNAATQIIKSEQFLPIPLNESKTSDSLDYIFEPSQDSIISTLIPKSLKMQLFKAIRDSFASEHGARMTAMHKATDNASELRDELKLTYNKARQASITNEILEIVGGAEALNN